MKRVVPTTRYKKDIKRLQHRRYDFKKLLEILQYLENEYPLPLVTRPHKLTGEWLGFWECHIAPDWLLIYDVAEAAILLARTGTHADLFE
jgi:mRNA interferase YafQ